MWKVFQAPSPVKGNGAEGEKNHFPVKATGRLLVTDPTLCAYRQHQLDSGVANNKKVFEGGYINTHCKNKCSIQRIKQKV